MCVDLGGNSGVAHGWGASGVEFARWFGRSLVHEAMIGEVRRGGENGVTGAWGRGYALGEGPYGETAGIPLS